MRCLRETCLIALVTALVLGLSAAQRTAEAGLCRKEGFDNQCVVRKDIKKEAVNSGRVLDESLTGADIKNGTIGNADLAAGIVSADEVLARILVVSPVGNGSDAALNGAELLAAITSWAASSRRPAQPTPGPSSSSPASTMWAPPRSRCCPTSTWKARAGGSRRSRGRSKALSPSSPVW